MKTLFLALALLFFAHVQAATSGGKGGKLGFSSGSGHGNTGGGGGGSFSTTGRSTYRDPRSAPPLDERRKVSEQDCTKPIDPSSGNLRCK
jgi:hypothetical protein